MKWDIDSKLDGDSFEREQSLAYKNSRQKEFGFDDDDFGDFGSFGSFGSFGNDSFGNDSFGNDSFGGSDSFGGGNSFGGGFDAFGGSMNAGASYNNNTSNNNQTGSSADVWEQRFITASKNGYEVGKNFVSFSLDAFPIVMKDSALRQQFMFTVMKILAGFAIFFLALELIFSFPLGLIIKTYTIISFSVGTIWLGDIYFSRPELLDTSEVEREVGFDTSDVVGFEDIDEPEVWGSDNNGVSDSGFGSFGGFEDIEEDEFEEDELEDDEYEDEYEDLEDFDEFEKEYNSTSHFAEEHQGESFEPTEDSAQGILDRFGDVSEDLVSRSLLFDAYLNMLYSDGKTDVSYERELEVDSEEALKYMSVIREAQEVAGFKNFDDTTLKSIIDRTFTVELVVSREKASPSAIDKFQAELTAKIAFDGKVSRPSVYSTVNAYGKDLHITIYKGVNPMVYLRDLLKKSRDFFEDTSNVFPVCFGFNERGEPINVDMYQQESIICSGEARSGKSLQVTSIVNQICHFASPKQVHLYVGDIKAGVSDWKIFSVPHFKRFETTPEGILNMLTHVVEEVAPERVRILEEAGHVNIKDYNEEYPDEVLPIIYIVLDEIIGMTAESEDDTKKQIMKLMTKIITQYPAHGIRMFLIPHVMKNQFLDKTITQLVSTKMVFRQNYEMIKEVFGVSRAIFPYNLVQAGECAFKLPIEPYPIYVHAPLLTKLKDRKQTSRLFDTQRKIWSDKYPDEVADSSYVRDQLKKESGKALSKLGFSEQQIKAEDVNVNVDSFEEEDWISELRGKDF